MLFGDSGSSAQLAQVLLQEKAAVFLKPLGVLVNEALVSSAQLKQHAADGVQERDVAAGCDR